MRRQPVGRLHFAATLSANRALYTRFGTWAAWLRCHSQCVTLFLLQEAIMFKRIAMTLTFLAAFGAVVARKDWTLLRGQTLGQIFANQDFCDGIPFAVGICAV